MRCVVAWFGWNDQNRYSSEFVSQRVRLSESLSLSENPSRACRVSQSMTLVRLVLVTVHVLYFQFPPQTSSLASVRRRSRPSAPRKRGRRVGGLAARRRRLWGTAAAAAAARGGRGTQRVSKSFKRSCAQRRRSCATTFTPARSAATRCAPPSSTAPRRGGSARSTCGRRRALRRSARSFASRSRRVSSRDVERRVLRKDGRGVGLATTRGGSNLPL